MSACNGTNDDTEQPTAGFSDGETRAENRLDMQPSSTDRDTGVDEGDLGHSPVERVTFYQDVAPILDKHCMGCHASTGIGPMSFETLDDVRTWAIPIVASTKARTMPPWFARADGSCGDFKDSEWLTERELQTLENWANSGMEAGDVVPRPMPQTDALQDTLALETPTFFPERAGGLFAQFDEYRCFAFELPPSTNDRYLTGYEVLPGNPAIVHHVIGSFVDPTRRARGGIDRTNGEQMSFLDDESPNRDGWPCFTGAGEKVRVDSEPIAWAPGQGVIRLPAGTGVRVSPGAVLVLQVHYNLADDENIGSSDQSVIKIQLSNSVDEPLRPIYIDYFLEDFYNNRIPRGESDHLFERQRRLSNYGIDGSARIWGILPHMHERGFELNATLNTGDDEQCMIQVDQWDFAWQRTYWYETPITLQPDDFWSIGCRYNTEDARGAILPGWGTRNEMCLTVLYVSGGE